MRKITNRLRNLEVNFAILRWLVVLFVGGSFVRGGTIQASDISFGSFFLSIDNQPSVQYHIREALLYRRVAVRFDTTAQVQNKKGISHFLYPQLERGTGNILRFLIFEVGSSKNHQFYDLFIDLGDSLPDSVVWRGAEDRIFLAHNAMLQPVSISTHNINGKIVFTHIDENKEVEGTLAVEFDSRAAIPEGQAHHIKMEGQFKVPMGEFRAASLASVTKEKEMEGKYRRNIYLAIVMTIFLVIIFGVQ